MTGDRCRLLVVAPFAPDRRATHGSARAMGGLLAALAPMIDVAVVHVAADADDAVDPDLAAQLDLVRAVPQPPRDGRVRQLVSLIRGRPLWMQSWWSDELIHAVEDLIDTWRPDVVQVELDVMAPAVAAAGHRGVPVVFVVHEPAWSMVPSPPGRPLLAVLDRRAWVRTETSATSTAATTVVFTERDAALVAAPVGEIEVIPLGVDGMPRGSDRCQTASLPQVPSSGDSARVVFVGGAGHPPNVDAVDRLVRCVLPRLLEHRDDVRLVLVGDVQEGSSSRCPCPRGDCDHVEVLGRVADVAQVIDSATVVVAPLRLGGGMRVKVLDALAQGAAVVATSIALTGLDDAIAAGAVRRADTDAEIVGAILELIADPATRTRLQHQAHRWTRDDAGWQTRASRYVDLYRRLLGRHEPVARIA